MSNASENQSSTAYDEWPACPDKPPLHLKGGYLCIVSPLSLREACFSAPAVRAIRASRPNSTIAILCPESQTALWSMMSQVNKVISYPDNAWARQIAALVEQDSTSYESSIAWEACEAAKALKQVGILQRLGYPAARLVPYLTDSVKVVVSPGPVAHRVRYYLDFAERLGVNAYNPQSFRTAYQSTFSKGGKLRIAVAASSSYGDAYQWSVERFSNVVQSTGFGVTIEWVVIPEFFQGKQRKSKQPVNSEILQQSIDSGEVVTEGQGVKETLSMLRTCHLLLASDGVVAHLAAHLGMPAVVIFGPNEPEYQRPLGKQSRVIREHVACSPCFLSKCPIDHRCQNDISVQQVVSEISEVISMLNASD